MFYQTSVPPRLNQSGRSKTSRDTHEEVADDSVEMGGVVEDEGSTADDEDSADVDD
jgi:hypothetical protein